MRPLPPRRPIPLVALAAAAVACQAGGCSSTARVTLEPAPEARASESTSRTGAPYGVGGAPPRQQPPPDGYSWNGSSRRVTEGRPAPATDGPAPQYGTPYGASTQQGGANGTGDAYAGPRVMAMPGPTPPPGAAPENAYAGGPPQSHVTGTRYAPAASPSPDYTAPAAHTGYGRGGAEAGAIVVQEGDTLYGLSRRHGVSISALMDENALQSPGIQVGQTLRLPARTRAR